MFSVPFLLEVYGLVVEVNMSKHHRMVTLC
jgi:hypothetical protein